MSSRYDVHPMEQNFRDWDKKIKEEDYALNNFIAARWDELTKAGKHGHYETLYRLVRDAIKFRREQQEGAMNTEVVPIAWAEIDFGGTIIGVSLEQDHSSPFKWMPLYTDSLSLQERRVAQRRSKVDNDLAELYARRDKDRRAAAPNTAVVYQCPRCATSMEVDLTAKPSSAVPPNHIDLEVLWSKHKTGNDENARMDKESFRAAILEAAAPNAAQPIVEHPVYRDGEFVGMLHRNLDGSTPAAPELICPMTATVCYDPSSDPERMCHPGYCRKQFAPSPGITYAPTTSSLKLHGPTSGGMVAAPDSAPCACEYGCETQEEHDEHWPAPSKESKLPLSAEWLDKWLHMVESSSVSFQTKNEAFLIRNQSIAAIELERDNARHVQIAADQANEIAELKRTTIKLTPVELQSGLDRVRFAELLIKQLPETHDGRNTWLLNYSPDMADELKQRLKLAENLRGRTRIEGEEVGAPHLKED